VKNIDEILDGGMLASINLPTTLPPQSTTKDFVPANIATAGFDLPGTPIGIPVPSSTILSSS
jgi:hypothetical protein